MEERTHSEVFLFFGLIFRLCLSKILLHNKFSFCYWVICDLWSSKVELFLEYVHTFTPVCAQLIMQITVRCQADGSVIFTTFWHFTNRRTVITTNRVHNHDNLPLNAILIDRNWARWGKRCLRCENLALKLNIID